MAQTETVTTTPVRVDVRSIEKQLAGLWRSAAEGAVPGVTGAVTRTLLLNLLVYAASDKEADEAARVVADLAAEHPSRAIIADSAPGEPGHELEADVSMFCTIGERGRRLCGESIRLHAHGVSASALGTIMPVLAPDLPIFLWTPGSLDHARETLQGFVEIADHWIIDSRRFSDRSAMYKFARELATSIHSGVALHDLAWASLARLREAVASLFDTPAALHYLRGIRKVMITYQGEKSAPPIEALMMAAWLSTQLKLEVSAVDRQPEGMNITAVREGTSIGFVLASKIDATSPVDEVVIECQSDGRSGILRVGSGDHSEEVFAIVDAPDLPSGRRAIQIAPQPLVREVDQVLDVPGRDRLYENALPNLCRLIDEAQI